jgi:sulfate adenylyltransferase subunit 2
MEAVMDRLDALEAQSIYVLREARRRLEPLVALWSVGKDSNTLLWLARKAFCRPAQRRETR